jgi:hypothetical protein
LQSRFIAIPKRGEADETNCNLTLGGPRWLSHSRVRCPRAAPAPNASIQGTWAFGVDTQYEGDAQANGMLTFVGNGGLIKVLTYDKYGIVCQGMTPSGSYTVNPS